MLVTISLVIGLVCTVKASTSDHDVRGIDLNVIQNEILELKEQEDKHYKDVKNEIRLLRDEISGSEVGLENDTWTGWSACSRDCGTGTQERTRTSHSGVERQLQYCNLQACQSSGKPCLGGSYCGHVQSSAVCQNGTCVCRGEGYNQYTCLPEVGSCKIQIDPKITVGQKSRNTSISGGYRLHSCTANDNSHYEVHMVGIYGDNRYRDMRISLIPKDEVKKPIIIVLTSYETTYWTIDSPVKIQKVIHGGYKTSTVTLSNNSAVAIERDASLRYSYGSPRDGTRANLQRISALYGPVSSFTGYYELDPPSPTIEILIGGNPLEAKTEIFPSFTLLPTTASTNTTTSSVPVTDSGRGVWGPWGACSRPCDIGTQRRYQMTNGTSESEVQYCNLNNCADSAISNCSGQGFASCWHFTSMASCVNGKCICTQTYYNNYTCLPEVGNCVIRKEPPMAIGRASNDTRRGYPLYSCTTNDNKAYEVHVVGIYGDRTDNVMNIRLIKRAVVNKPIILILTSYEPTNWKIRTSTKIQKLVMTYFRSEGSLEYNASMVHDVEKNRSRTFGYGHDGGGGRTGQMLSEIYNQYGPITSFTGYYELSSPPTPSIEIFVGGNPLAALEVIPTLPPTTPPATTTTTTTPSTTSYQVDTLSSEGRECLESRTCWLKLRFNYDKIWTACFGDQYVRKTGLSVGAYIGVVLCNDQGNKYKLFMSDDLNSMFLNMADSSGHGQDHCELVGGDIKKARLPNDFWDSPSATGYYRSEAGQQFKLGQIGFGPKDMSAWTGKYYCKWYECGVSIPGNKTVLIN